MRILFVTSLYLPWLGGLEVLTAQLAQEYRRRGHEVAVVTGVNERRVPFGPAEVDGIPVMRTDCYNIAQRHLEPRDLLLRWRATREFVEDFGPDVVHAQDPGPTLLTYRRAIRVQRPILVTLHNVMSLLSPESLPILGRALQDVEVVTGVSDDVVRDALEWAPWLEDRLSVIPNGVAPPQRGPTGIPDGPAHFLGIGRLAPQKGFELALDAMALLVRDRPDARLTIAGVGEELAALVRRSADLGLTEHVTFAGRVEPQRMADLIDTATAVLMPSRFEGMPLVAIEAAWGARPVVGTAAPGLRCVVRDEVTGLLAPDRDPAQLADRLARVTDDRELARQLGDAARDRAQQEYTIEACATSYEKLYLSLVA